jgi:hypothetical protein
MASEASNVAAQDRYLQLPLIATSDKISFKSEGSASSDDAMGKSGVVSSCNGWDDDAWSLTRQLSAMGGLRDGQANIT